MKKTLALLLVCLLAAPSFACWGFRPMGMGGAFVAVADDANLAYWNRAGSALLDNWKDGEKQLATSSDVWDQKGLFNRAPRSGNTYYDSLNFAQKINENFGWSFASTWNGGSSYVLSPGIGFRLPWNMAIGLGYYHWLYESYADIHNDGGRERLDVLYRQIHLDYLWKLHQEFNFGVHIERFWQLDYKATSPDDPAWSQSASEKIGEQMNVRPGIAWMPQGGLKGLTVNAGLYDMLNKMGGGTHFSAGFEYAPPKEREKTSFSAFRGGLYNLGGNGSEYSMLTLGYGYKFSPDFELGYWGGLGISKAAAGNFENQIGIAWRF